MTLRDYINVLKRRRVIVLVAFLLVPIAATAYSLHQQRLYQANAVVLLREQSLSDILQNSPSPQPAQAARIVSTEAEVARVDVIIKRVLKAAGSRETVAAFLVHSSVSADPNADLLTFRVNSQEPATASRFVDLYAQEYVRYHMALELGPIETARASLATKMSALSRSGGTSGALYQSLLSRDQQLAALEALATTGASVIQPAVSTPQVQPRLQRNVALGLVVGLILGVALAFVRETLDTRIRSIDEISGALGVPILARILAPRPSFTGGGLAMMERPFSVESEPYRILRSSFEFANLSLGATSVLVTSGFSAEGKSTTVANLAVALARGGVDVVLVDLDLRQPGIARLFKLDGPGVTEVVLGTVPLDDALRTIVLSDQGRSDANGAAAAGDGTLKVLTAGLLPPSPGEFVQSPRLVSLLRHLASSCDLLLIDTPPALVVGDALSLSAHADAILFCVRPDKTTIRSLGHLAEVLKAAPISKLGAVITGDSDTDLPYGYTSYSYASAPAGTSR